MSFHKTYVISRDSFTSKDSSSLFTAYYFVTKSIDMMVVEDENEKHLVLSFAGITVNTNGKPATVWNLQSIKNFTDEDDSDWLFMEDKIELEFATRIAPCLYLEMEII